GCRGAGPATGRADGHDRDSLPLRPGRLRRFNNRLMVPTMSADKDYVMSRSVSTNTQGRMAQRGTALIEFTLILPLLLIMTVAAVDFGRAFFVKNVVSQAAREGVRLRAVSSSADSGLVRTRVLQVANAANVTVSNLTIAGPDASRQVTVTVTAE